MRELKMVTLTLGIACADSNKEQDLDTGTVDLADDTGGLETTDSGESDSGEEDTEPEEETGSSIPPTPSLDIQSITGSIVWTLDFDGTAEENGFTDCSYQRDYTGTEDWSAKWLCPDCDKSFLVDVDVSAGLEDCYAQIASDPAPQERLGWTSEGVFRRGAAPAYKLSEQGMTYWDGDTQFSTSNQVESELNDGAGNFTFNIQGDFSLEVSNQDPLHGFNPPDEYACGWPKADPPAYEGDHSVSVGAQLPDGYFKDQCAEPVRLHDFAGRYLVVDVSATNCPPCKSMAEQEPAFADAMIEAGIDVSMITLMAPSLSEVLSPTPTETLVDWATTYDLHDPVLEDRGWGYWLLGTALGDDFGYPSWVIVSPDLNVIEIGNGFSSFDGIANTIETHAAGQ